MDPEPCGRPTSTIRRLPAPAPKITSCQSPRRRRPCIHHLTVLWPSHWKKTITTGNQTTQHTRNESVCSLCVCAEKRYSARQLYPSCICPLVSPAALNVCQYHFPGCRQDLMPAFLYSGCQKHFYTSSHLYVLPLQQYTLINSPSGRWGPPFDIGTKRHKG